MKYEEFSACEPYVDAQNKIVRAYSDEEGNIFYVEPGFYDGLMGFQDKRPECFQQILDAFFACVKKNHKVIFTADFEHPWIEREGFVYREIQDLTDPLLIFVEDKSRGSDYGD